jgi:hypothetical protein
VPPTVAQDHPNLQEAVGRFHRLSWVWGLLCAGVGGLSLAVGGAAHFGVTLGWAALAALLVTQMQPLLLACVAVALGFSLIFLVPGVDRVLGPDALAGLLGGGLPGILGMGLVRILLMVTAWNQLLFYRLLYGSERLGPLDPTLPAIPEMISNGSDRAAWAARLSGLLALLLGFASVPLRGLAVLPQVLGLCYSLGVLGAGLGLGAAFSPTHHRGVALTGVGLSSLAIVLTLLIGRAFLG